MYIDYGEDHYIATTIVVAEVESESTAHLVNTHASIDTSTVI